MGFIVLLTIAMVVPAWAAETIKIALFDPRSGPFKRTGDTYAAAVEFLVEEINESGGLLGRKVELIEEDSQLKPDVAVRKATKNVMDGVKFLGTGTGTHVGLALQQVAAKEKVIFFNYGAEGDEITGKFCNPYTFRISLPIPKCAPWPSPIFWPLNPSRSSTPLIWTMPSAMMLPRVLFAG